MVNYYLTITCSLLEDTKDEKEEEADNSPKIKVFKTESLPYEHKNSELLKTGKLMKISLKI